MNLTTLGIDLAKTSFSLVGMDQQGKVVLRKTLKRAAAALYRSMPHEFNRYGSL